VLSSLLVAAVLTVMESVITGPAGGRTRQLRRPSRRLTRAGPPHAWRRMTATRSDRVTCSMCGSTGGPS
jgi:hypothetical protein